MPASVPFALVDVFADAPFAGNPLAVVPDAGDIADALLPRIAREFNQSETTFLVPPTRPGADWRLRSFTPAGIEVFGAGHNALGAWWWLAAAGRLSLAAPRTTFHQELGPRVLPVEISADRVAGAWTPTAVGMTQAPAVFADDGAPADVAPLAAALGLRPSDLAASDLPPCVVSTGAAHLLVALTDRSTVDRARPDATALASVLRAAGGEGCYLFSLVPGDDAATAYARFFNPTVGITEDPATGSAAGPLACYLARHHRVASDALIHIAQGHATGRPSRIDVRLIGPTAQILGRGFIVADGRLHIVNA